VKIKDRNMLLEIAVAALSLKTFKNHRIRIVECFATLFNNRLSKLLSKVTYM